VMRAVSLGHAARNQAGIKVRQPLELAVVKARSESEAEGLVHLVDQIRDELNVHQVEITTEEQRVVDFCINAIPSEVGKRYKALFPAIRQALSALDREATLAAVRALQRGDDLHFSVEGQDVSLAPQDVEVKRVAAEGFVIAEEGGLIVSLNTAISEELRMEGIAREIVRRIQTMRKDADFRIEDTIVTYYQAGEVLTAVLQAWADYIQQETLSALLLDSAPPSGAHVETHDVDGQSVTLGILSSEG